MLQTLLKIFILSFILYSDTVWSCPTGMGDSEKLEEASPERPVSTRLPPIADLEQKIMKGHLQSERIMGQGTLLFRRLNEQEITETTQKLLAISPQRLNSIIEIMERHPAIQVTLLLSGHVKEISDEGFASLVSSMHENLEFQDLWTMFYKQKLEEKKQRILYGK